MSIKYMKIKMKLTIPPWRIEYLNRKNWSIFEYTIKQSLQIDD